LVRKPFHGGGAIVAFFLLASVAHAQCPDANTPYPGPAWNGPNWQTEIVGPGCLADVEWCSRVEGGVMHFWIAQVKPHETSTGCGALAPDVLIKNAITAFENGSPPGSVDIPDCSNDESTYIRIDYTVAYCWALHHWYNADGTFTTTFGPCTGGSSFCVRSCHYCNDPVTHALSVTCSYAGQWNGDCTNIPTEAPWIPEQCYNFNPCGN
jgi:hypothetical protein